jgi:hypothetical protein
MTRYEEALATYDGPPLAIEPGVACDRHPAHHDVGHCGEAIDH